MESNPTNPIAPSSAITPEQGDKPNVPPGYKISKKGQLKKIKTKEEKLLKKQKKHEKKEKKHKAEFGTTEGEKIKPLSSSETAANIMGGGGDQKKIQAPDLLEKKENMTA